MKRIVIVAVLLAFLMFGCVSFNPNSTRDSAKNPINIVEPFEAEYREGEVLVGYRTLEDLEKLAQAIGAQIDVVVPQIKAASLKFSGRTVKQVVNEIRKLKLSGIDYVEPSYERKLPVLPLEDQTISSVFLKSAPTSQDDWFIYQYPHRLFDSQSIWSAGYKGTGVIVAVIDTGVNGTHPDLVGRVLTGYNARTGGTFQPDSNSDTHGHGTHCAGIIAAAIGGGKVVGLAPEVYVMPVRIFDPSYVGDINTAAGIVWAVENGAQVLSNSWGGPGYSETIKRAIDYALRRNVVVVFSAGNDYSDQAWHYPSAHTGVIGVAATTANDKVTSFSSRGEYVSVGAPGDYVLSTYHVNALLNQPYVFMSGTSMACPYVSAAAALLKQKYPDANCYQIRKLLEMTAVDIESPGYDVASGHGRIDPKAALGLDPNKPAPDLDELQPATLKVKVVNRQGNPIDDVFVTIIHRASGKAYYEKTYYDEDDDELVARFEFVEPGTYDVYIGGPDMYLGELSLSFPEEQLHYKRTVTLLGGQTTLLTQTFLSSLKIELPRRSSSYTVDLINGTTGETISLNVPAGTGYFTYVLPSSASPGKYLMVHNVGEDLRANITLNGHTFEMESLYDSNIGAYVFVRYSLLFEDWRPFLYIF
ncbi:peptidase S8 [Pseudothermotoga hypogea DSM 11164 = NBRC 106472]|uniref:Peptidase S8 n=1 Tax=Pseudothermotoga hypogea DSM 11164 = NBRC 106472 TaxID=1123384 RepID=A0A0X1KQB2_9THEM|nr:S8 family serine peptidase [Pseudothermotoga hypogea]AJC73486.1 peptidase S8 [Pseudothermotoga hypogea DSM 11164 = NBRC 106472]